MCARWDSNPHGSQGTFALGRGALTGMNATGLKSRRVYQFRHGRTNHAGVRTGRIDLRSRWADRMGGRPESHEPKLTTPARHRTASGGRRGF